MGVNFPTKVPGSKSNDSSDAARGPWLDPLRLPLSSRVEEEEGVRLCGGERGLGGELGVLGVPSAPSPAPSPAPAPSPTDNLRWLDR